MATFQILRNRQTKMRASVRKSFSEDVFQSVRSLLQSEKELCSVSAEDCGKQDGPVSVTEVTFLGFNEETDAAHIQDLAAVSLELPDLLNSLHFCSLNENEIICMKDINKSSAVSNGPVNQSHHSGMLCVMRVSPTAPRLRVDFISGLLSKYATGIRHTMDTQLRRKRHREAAGDDGDDTGQSVSSIEDDFVTALEHLEDEETSKSYDDGVNITAPKSQGDAASQRAAAHHLEPHDLRILVSSGRQVLSAKPPTSLINILGHKEQPVKTSVTTSVSEPWIQRSFYRSSNAPDKGSGTQKTVFSSSPAYSSESECSSPSPVIFLDEEGYQKSLKAKLELPKIPVTKDDIEDSDSEVSEFFDSFDQFDELEQTLETSGPFLEDCVTGKPLQKKGQKHEKACSAATAMNPQKFKSDRPALPAHVRKPTPRKPESPHLCEAPDSPRPVTASGEDRGLFSPIRSSAFSPLGGSTPVECFCQTNAGGERIHEEHDSVYYTYEDYADSISCEVLGSVLHTQHTDATSNAVSVKKENEAIALKSGSLNQKSKSRTASLMIKDSIQKFAADLVEKSFVGAFKDLQKGVSSCTNALCHLAVRLTASVFQMAFNELRRQRAFSLQERAIGGLANFLVSEALSNALQDLQYMRKQMLASTAAGFAAGLAEELVFEGVMEVCQLSCPPTPASLPRPPFDSDKDKAVKSYAKDLSESVIQEAFIELSQVDVTFAAKAAVSVSTDNVKCVSAENLVPLTETPTFPPAFNNQAVTATRPAQDCEKEYTVQQALFCTSGIVTSIPMPLAGSALLPYHFSANACQAKSHLSSGDSNLSGGSAEAHVSTKNEEEGACLRNICLSSEHNPGNHSDLKPADDVVEVQSSSKLTSDPVIISNFSAAMVHAIVNETLESVTSFKDTKTAGEHTDCLTKTVKGTTPFHHDQVTLQQSEASRKDMFADQLSKSIIKHSIDKSKSVTLNVDKHVEHKEGLPVPGEASQRSTLEKCPKFPDAQGHLNHCLLSAGRDGVPECRGSAAHGFSLGTPPRCTAAAGQRPDLKEAAKDKSVKKNNLSNTTPEPLSFGQESPFPHSHAFSSTVLTCVDGLHVEEKQKIRDGNVMPDTPPSTPLVPSRASSECDIKKLTTKLKGELAKDFAPATPPSTPHNSSGGSLSENEQNAIEKEEFMLKLMRSLSEEVESGDGEGRPEVDVKSEHSGKKAQFAEALATRIVSLATEVAASHLDNKIIPEPRVKSPCLNVQSQRSVSPTFLNHSGEDLQTLRNFAGDMAAEVVTEAEHIAKVTSRLLFKQRRSSCYVEGGQDDRSEKSHVEATAHPREDLFILSLPSSRTSGLTYKYPSCESVTDEYAGHIIQILKREGGDSELLVDQFANRLAYRSVKSGLQEAARTARVERSSQTPLAQSSGAETSSDLSVFLQKEHHQGAGKKRQRKRSGGHACKPQTCARARDTCRGECSELDGFSTSLARSIARDARRALTAPAGGRPQPAADSCCREQPGWPVGAESPAEPAFPEPLQPALQSHGFYHRTGGVSGRGCGESVIPAVDQGAGEVPGDTLELSPGPAGVCASESAKAAGGTTCAPPAGQACRRCDHRDRHDRGGSSAQHLFRQDARSEPLSESKLGHICQKPRIFHLDVPHVHVDLDKKTVLAEKIVAEAIERAERELSAASVAAGSGSGQEGVGFAESLTSEIMASAMAGVGRALSSPKEIEDLQSAESLGSQQMNLSVGDDSTGSWSNLSFEDEHQDESSSFHHLSESDGPDDKDEEHEDEIEGLEQDGKTLLITNIDMEPCTVDPQLRVILQWLVASEVEVAQLAFHDSAKKEFVRLSKRLQEKGWKVGDLLQAVLKYYDVTEKTHSEDKCKSLFDWLLENA